MIYIQMTKKTRELVGFYVTQRVPSVQSSLRVSEALKYVEKNVRNFDSINYIYVVSARGSLRGVVSIKELYEVSADLRVGSMGVRGDDVASVGVRVDKERAVRVALRLGISAVPVVDRNKKFVGVIASDQILKILDEELHEDVLKSVGIHHSEMDIVDTNKMSIWKSYINRLPWIWIGMVGGILLAQVIGLFEDVLSQDLILAGFLPLVVYLSNAVGMQVQVVLIRDLSLDRVGAVMGYMWRQILVSLLIATSSAVGVWVLVWLGWGNLLLGSVVGIAVWCAIMTAVCLSVVIPWWLYKARKDPAVASGPFVTILQDALSVVIYFLVASVVM
jgi:magnesium transporter